MVKTGTTTNAEDFVSPQELTGVLHRSLNSIYADLADGRLPGEKAPGRRGQWIIRLSQVSSALGITLRRDKSGVIVAERESVPLVASGAEGAA